MFGYLSPNLNIMSEEDKKIYKSYYCGVCKEINKRYGNISRITMSYDVVFLAILYDAIYMHDIKITKQNCILHPIKKRNVCNKTTGISIRADLQIILTYAKLQDTIRDDKGVKTILRQTEINLLKKHYENLKYIYLDLCNEIEYQNEKQFSIEKDSIDIDIAAQPTAEMLKSIINCFFNDNITILTKFRFFLGRYIYLIDALDDRKSDKKSNSFNIFNILNYDNTQAKEECFLTLSELSFWYNKIEIKQYKSIINNIIYSSLKSHIIRLTKESEKNGI